MTALLYYSYSSGFSENEAVGIDKQVCRNRELVYIFITKLPLNAKRKAKRLWLYVMFTFAISQPLAPCAAVVLPLPPTSIERLIPNQLDSETRNIVKTAPVIKDRVNKVVLTDKQMDQLYDLAIKCRNNSISKEELVMELRGGGIEDWVGAFGIVIAIIMVLNNIAAFQVHPAPGAIVPPHLKWLYGNQQPGYPSPSTSLDLQRPSAIPHPEYVGMTKEEKRNLPDERDGFITVEGHPHLVARYGQVEFKTPNHGSVHDLPINEKGQTPKTEENALALRDSIVNMPNRKGIIWFENGMYQGGTERGYDSVNIYDQETRVIAIFKKLKNGEYSQFSTTCEVTAKEETHLFESDGNYVTEAVLNNQKALIIIKNPNIER